MGTPSKGRCCSNIDYNRRFQFLVFILIHRFTNTHVCVYDGGMVNVKLYPQLSLITSSHPWRTTMEDDEVFALYEANWRFVDQQAIIPEEKELIGRLAAKFGGGVLNV